MHNCKKKGAMIKNFIPRSLEPVIRKAVTEFPAVVLTAPRQSGKTTLLKHLFSEHWQPVGKGKWSRYERRS